MHCLKQLVDMDIVYWKCLQAQETMCCTQMAPEMNHVLEDYCTGILSKTPGTTSQREDAEERAQQDDLQ